MPQPEQETRDGCSQLPRIAADAGRQEIIVARVAGTITSLAELDAALATARSLPELKNLHDYAAAMEGLAKQMKLAFEQVFSIAVTRLRVERKLGHEIAQRVKWGGLRARSHDGTLAEGLGRLPKNISKRMASRYRQAAAVAPECFELFIARQRERSELPTCNGLLRFWSLGQRGDTHASSGRRSRKSKRQSTETSYPEVAVPQAVVDTIQRICPIGVCVRAGGLFPGARCMEPEVMLEEASGSMFVASCPEPERWLPGLAALFRRGRVDQVFVAMPAEPWRGWFQSACRSGWLCFFPARTPIVVLYLGRHVEGVAVALHGVGTAVVAKLEST